MIRVVTAADFSGLPQVPPACIDITRAYTLVVNALYAVTKVPSASASAIWTSLEYSKTRLPFPSGLPLLNLDS